MFWSCFHQKHFVKVWIASYKNKVLTWEQADRRLFSPSILKTIDVFLTVAFTIISVSHSTHLSLVMKLIFVFSTSLIYDSLMSILQPFSVVDNKMPLLNDQQKKKNKTLKSSILQRKGDYINYGRMGLTYSNWGFSPHPSLLYSTHNTYLADFSSLCIYMGISLSMVFSRVSSR